MVLLTYEGAMICPQEVVWTRMCRWLTWSAITRLWTRGSWSPPSPPPAAVSLSPPTTGVFMPWAAQVSPKNEADTTLKVGRIPHFLDTCQSAGCV